MSDDPIGEWLRDNIAGPLFGWRWITLRSGTVVKIDPDGRVLVGGPPEWHGVHIGDIKELGRRTRELEAIDCSDTCKTCPETFPNKMAGVTALLDANPPLFDFLQAQGGSAHEQQFRDWIRSGRKGQKPQLADGDGRFDAVNEKHNLRGARAVSSWLEAVWVTVPTSRRWDAFAGRLPALEEALSDANADVPSLALPGPAEKRRIGKLSTEECEKRVDEQLAELLAEARADRLTPSTEKPSEGATP